LLVEFLFDDPYGRDKSEVFPFLLGQARALGLEAAWLFAGIYSRDTSGHLDKHTVRLAPAETRALLEAIGAFGPSHVVFSEAIDDELQGRLAETVPAVEPIPIWNDPDVRSLYCPADWLPRRLGLPTAGWEGRYLADAVEPRYENRLIQPPPGHAEPARPYIAVIGGPVCLYGRKLARNPYYADLELPGGLADIGCAFCRKRELHYRLRTPPIDLALRQCRAAAATARRFSADTYLIRAARVALCFGDFVQAVLDCGLPPSRFLFSYRVDELLRVAEQINAQLPGLARAGHRVRIYNPGIENFSPRENERFNKGITPEQVDRAVEHIRRWAQSYPDTFSFESFGMILYTPWTTLGDVEINYRRLRRFTFPEIGMEWRRLRSKLQILPETAIARLADRHGALVDSFDGFFFWDGRCLGDPRQRELPWRFLDPRVAGYYELVWRLTSAQEPGCRPADPLAEQVLGLFDSRPDRWPHVLDFLLDALAAAAEDPPAPGPADLLERLRRALPPPPPPPEPVRDTRAPCADPDPTSVRQANTRLERLLEAEAPRLRALLKRLLASPRSPLPGWRLYAFEPHPWDGAYTLTLELRRAADRLELRLVTSDVPGPAFVEHGPLKLWFTEATPLDTPEKEEGVRRLARLLGAALGRRCRTRLACSPASVGRSRRGCG
jgi:hypothetical protein